MLIKLQQYIIYIPTRMAKMKDNTIITEIMKRLEPWYTAAEDANQFNQFGKLSVSTKPEHTHVQRSIIYF